MEYVNRTCIICDQLSTPITAVSSLLPAENLSFEQLKSQWSGFFRDNIKSFFSYCRCPQCHVLFCPTFFSNDQLINLYENMADNTANIDLESLKRTQRGYFNFLKKYMRDLKGDYFEMGPDIGLFTENILSEDHFEHIWLAEPNMAVWDTLKTKLVMNHYSLFKDLLTDAPIIDDTLGAAVLIHVLDHLLDPLETLVYLRSKMKKDAILLIVTHDESSLLAKLFGYRWPAYCLQHPQLYNSSSIKNLLQKAGFKTLATKKTYNSFPLGYLLNHFVWAIGIKKTIFPNLNFLSIPLKLGNIITIASA